jgi:hypothetical protein
MKIGAKLVDVRNMTNKELENEGWDDYHSEQDDIKVLVFDDGNIIYPSMDYEGNQPGVFFGYKKSVYRDEKGVRQTKHEHFAF